ncbi:hypothetical protein G7Y89_g6066 [Cudoniella acicularis]|uniref:Carrier domain-containing protein n=1 Tax=Cudoniella acicularis TaxID=354080 RepID=A0A8H4RNM2_9HELO|nr:hypothetical protein G7Y89_g6066 [Cudoniella acicularis]
MDSAYDISSFCKRLLPHIVDERARAGYSQPYALYPISRDPSKGFQSISYSRLANAVNRVCWWLESELAGEDEKARPFAYLGPNDLRYIIFVLAVMKTGRQILICSLRNTVDAQIALFQRANCGSLVSCSSLKQSLLSLFDASKDVRKLEAPSLDEVLATNSVPHYVYDVNFETLSNSPIIHIHTSGSSAFNMYPAQYEMILVLGHPDVPMSAPYVSELLKHRAITSLLTPPSTLEELSKDLAAVKELGQLKHIGYGGGPLSPIVGANLAEKVPHLHSYIGATEEGWFYNISGDNSVWDSLKFYSDIGYRFDEISEGIFELVIVNDPRTNKYHGIFQVFPELKEYRMRDLYSKKSNNAGWMTYRGRADDLIVFSNGEKINPIPMENTIRSHPSVKAALIVGDFRFSPCLLIEMEADYVTVTNDEKSEALNRIWPSIQEANRIAPGYAKVSKSLVLFTTPDKPFLRAGKGTVQRQLSVKAYSTELEHLYSSQEATLLLEGLTLRNPASVEDISTLVKEIYAQTLDRTDLKELDDVFQNGMDSLRVSVVVSRLKAALKYCGIDVDPAQVNPRLVYSSPDISKLTTTILHLAGDQNGITNTKKPASNSRVQHMEAILDKFQKYLPEVGIQKVGTRVKDDHIHTKGWSVILTGTTGSLGSHLLATFEAMPDSIVSRIYCFNRSKDGRAKQEKASSARGLNTKWSSERIQFFQTDFLHETFGLPPKVFAKLLDEATAIIHCAWQVDFNLSLESFQPHIQGVQNLLDFSSKSTNKAPLVFISSISTALSMISRDPSAIVPEAVISEFEAPEKIGYAESKFVSEHLISQFSKASGVNAAIFRTGQISGPSKGGGLWNRNEWFPSLMTSSKYLGAIPSALGYFEALDWIPVDLLSSVIMELTSSVLERTEHEKGDTTVYNLVNPKVVTWSSIIHEVARLCDVPRVVGLDEWVQMLEESGRRDRSGMALQRNPALKLVEFFKILSEQGEGALKGMGRYEVVGLSNPSRTSTHPNPQIISIPNWHQEFTISFALKNIKQYFIFPQNVHNNLTLSRTHPLKVLFHLHSDLDPLDLCGPLEILSTHAKHEATKSPVFTATLTSSHATITSSQFALCFTNLLPIAEAYASLDSYDILVIPGGGSHPILAAKSEPIDLIRTFAALPPKSAERGVVLKERIILSVCTGSLFLAAAGVLNGLTATTHPFELHRLEAISKEEGETKVVGPKERFVVNAVGAGGKEGLRVITAGGVTCGIDAALWIVEEAVGRGGFRRTPLRTSPQTKDLKALVKSVQPDPNYVPSEDTVMPVYHDETGELLRNLPAPWSLRLRRKRWVELISKGVDVKWGKRLKHIETSENLITVTFGDDTKETGNLLVGCEGAHSPTREFLVGPKEATRTPYPCVSNVTVSKISRQAAIDLRALHPTQAVSFHPNGTSTFINLHDCSSEDPGEWTWMLIQSWLSDEEPTTNLLGDDKILAAMKERGKAFGYLLMSRGGLVTLAGDSAHAMTFHRGQGFNNAITDAADFLIQLRKMKEQTPQELAAAVQRYEVELWPRGHEAVMMSFVNTNVIHDWETLMTSPLLTKGMVRDEKGVVENMERDA